MGWLVACVLTARWPILCLGFTVDPDPTTTNRRSLPPSRRKAKKTFKNFDNMLDAFAQQDILVYFTKRTCGPCKLQTSELVSVQETLPVILTIDAEQFPSVGLRYSVGKLPCILHISQSQVMGRVEGLTTADDLLKLFAATDLSASNPSSPSSTTPSQ